jgi:hypothetical protein
MADDTEARQKISKKKKWTIGGALSIAASIASILGYLNSASGSNTPTPSSSSTTSVQSTYPAGAQQEFLNQCEGSGSSVAQCQCGLSWFESNVTLVRFQEDMAEYDQGTEPADLVEANDACNS